MMLDWISSGKAKSSHSMNVWQWLLKHWWGYFEAASLFSKRVNVNGQSLLWIGEQGMAARMAAPILRDSANPSTVCSSVAVGFFLYWAFTGPGTIADMKINKVSSSLPNTYTLLYPAKSAWSLHPCTPWFSGLLRDLGQLELILFVSLDGTVLIYCTVKCAPGSHSTNKQFPCLRSYFKVL